MTKLDFRKSCNEIKVDEYCSFNTIAIRGNNDRYCKEEVFTVYVDKKEFLVIPLILFQLKDNTYIYRSLPYFSFNKSDSVRVSHKCYFTWS